MEPLIAAVIALVGTTAVILLVGMLLTRAPSTGDRLRDLTSPEVESKRIAPTFHAQRDDSMPTLSKVLSGRRFTERLYIELSAAGLPIRPSEFVGIIAGLVLLSQILAGLLFRHVLAHVILGLIAVAVPIVVLKSLQHKRRLAFDNQIVDALVMMASSLRSGFSFLRAMQMVAQEMPPPISKEFERVIAEVNVGRSMEDALRGVVARVSSYDFDLVVTAVLIQLQVGGNLADILDTIANTIRERMRIMGEMRALTAEGRVSGIVLVLLPIILGLVLLMIRPEYMSTLFKETIGQYMIAAAVVLQIIGGLIIKKMLVLDI